MALKSSSQTLGSAFAGVGQAKKVAFDIETLQSAADIINTRLKESQASYSKKKKDRTTGGLLGSMFGTALGVGIGLATGGISNIGLMAAGALGATAGGEAGRSLGMGLDTGDVEMTDEYMELIKSKDPELAKRLGSMALKGTLSDQMDSYRDEQERTKEAEQSLATSLTGGIGGGKEGSYGSSLFKGHGGNTRYEVYGDMASGAFSGLTAGVAAGGKTGIAKRHASGTLAKGGGKGVEGWKSLRKMQGKDIVKNIGWMYTGDPKAKAPTAGDKDLSINMRQVNVTPTGATGGGKPAHLALESGIGSIENARMAGYADATKELGSSSKLGDWFAQTANAPAFSKYGVSGATPLYNQLYKQLSGYLDTRYQDQMSINAYDQPNYMSTSFNSYG